MLLPRFHHGLVVLRLLGAPLRQQQANQAPRRSIGLRTGVYRHHQDGFSCLGISSMPIQPGQIGRSRGKRRVGLHGGLEVGIGFVGLALGQILSTEVVVVAGQNGLARQDFSGPGCAKAGFKVNDHSSIQAGSDRGLAGHMALYKDINVSHPEIDAAAPVKHHRALNFLHGDRQLELVPDGIRQHRERETITSAAAPGLSRDGGVAYRIQEGLLLVLYQGVHDVLNAVIGGRSLHFGATQLQQKLRRQGKQFLCGGIY